jgi:antitoxin (DNA-binding transcriptional repressor) of toxin-antitoxin stability system
MVTADVGELKQHLAEYLERVKAGEEVVVTEGGQPNARFERLGAVAETEEERMEKLYAAGIVRRAEDPTPLPRDFWKDMPEDPEGLVLKAVLEERESGW